MINWQKVSAEALKKRRRVLTFSPNYDENDPMRYRILDSNFVGICCEVTHFAEVEEPIEIVNTGE